MRLVLLLIVVSLVTGCASAPPKAPSCDGPYRSLNPAHYDLVPQQDRDASPTPFRP